MTQKDSIKLLRECEAGCAMGISSIDEILDKVRDDKYVKILQESKDHHDKLKNEIHNLLVQAGSDDKEPSMMAEAMASMKTMFKMNMNESDQTAADLIVSGCQMGIRSLHKYKNKYANAGHTATDICNRLLDIEDELCHKSFAYL